MSTAEELQVQLEFTPNPDTLKYQTNRTLLPTGAANFVNAEAAIGKSPLAEELFKIPEVSAVMVGRNFITVTVTNQDLLMELNDKLTEIIRNFLLAGGIAVNADAMAKPSTPVTEIEQKICKILDEEIRPAVAMDGGDITFEKYQDGFVYLKMQGSCAGCPSSMMTLKQGVETRLREAVPEIQEVIPV